MGMLKSDNNWSQSVCQVGNRLNIPVHMYYVPWGGAPPHNKLDTKKLKKPSIEQQTLTFI